ncbi:phage tail tape measure protein [Nautilia sp. PV-1]|uniref:phage tail tape measure protein n=1 Tax=Nautilia sp. PV-1 TaxID=2579250 RepID=UPI000FD859CE|nr:phage tail tape measure protein [Nautilia sp. PV-1]AZV46841.1 phage tail tape measure protein [Nautilia sp. PV-1]
MPKTLGLDIVIGSAIGGAVSGFQSVIGEADKLGNVITKLNSKKLNVLSETPEVKKLNDRLSTLSQTIEHLYKKKRDLQIKKALAKSDEEAKKFDAELKKTNKNIAALNGHKLRISADLAKAKERAKQTNKEFKKLEHTVEKLNKYKLKINAMQIKRNEFRSKIFDTLAIGTAITIPFKAGIDFQSSMARVKALTGATGKEFDQLRATAKKLGATTVFSASEAAQGMQFLAMAGYKTNDIVKAMPGILNLASAGQLDLAQTADIASNILSGFNLKASQTTHVADVLAKAATSTNVTIGELGETMKYVAPVASNLGASMEEVTALTGLLGNVGIKGTQAGTALRAMYARLAAPPTEALKTMQKLGLVTKDANGKFVGMTNILKQLQEKTKGMSDTQKAAILKNLFGIESMSAAMALLKTPIKDIKKLTNELKNSDGTAKRIAKTQTDTVAGAFKQLGSAVEGVSIAFSSLFLPVIKTLTLGLAKVASWLNNFIEKHRILATVIGGVVGGIMAFSIAASVAGYAFSFLVTGVTRGLTAWTLLNENLTLANIKTKALTVWQTILSAKTKIATAVQWAWNAAMTANPLGLIVVAIGAVVAGVVWMYKKFDWFRSGVSAVWSGIKSVFTGAWEGIKAVFSAGWKFIKFIFSWSPIGLITSHWGEVTNWFGGFWQKIGKYFKIGVTYIANVFLAPIKFIKKIWENLLNWIKEKIGWIGKAVKGIAHFFGFGGDDKEKKSTVKKVATATVAATSITTAQSNLNVKPLTFPNSQINTASIETAAVKQNASSGSGQMVVYNFNFGDLKLDIKDGKIVNPQEFKAEIEKVLEEINFERHQRSLSDVV